MATVSVGLCAQTELIKTCFSHFGVDEIDWLALNPTEPLWDELRGPLQARPHPQSAVLNLTNAVLSDWEQFPAARFQHLVESLKALDWRLL